jgi:choice-of-anchor A domain-containing protein
MPGRRFLGWAPAAILIVAAPVPAAIGAHRTSVSARAADCADLGQAENFAVFSHGDFTSTSGTSINGRIAAAGDVTVDGISVSPVSGEPSPLILAGGNFIAGQTTHAGGTVNGPVTYGASASIAPNFTVTGGVTHAAPPFSFDTEFTNLRELSASLADEGQTAGASVTLNPYSSALELTGTDSGLNVGTATVSGIL